jgi:hypothetical protein
MKIYEDTSPRNPPEWCWHRGWATGHDSAYGLLMKFAFLNALTARELAELFASRERGKRTKLLRTMHFDLRDSENFDHAAMARAFGTDMNTVEGAFLDRRPARSHPPQTSSGVKSAWPTGCICRDCRWT